MRNSTRERSIGKSAFATIALIAIIMAGMVVWQHPSTAQAAVVGPTLTVEPSEYHAKKVGETFSINIKIYNVTGTEKLVAVEFKLYYDPNLLKIMEVKEGTFLQKFAGPPNGGMFIANDNRSDHWRFGRMIYPDGNGIWHEPFPSGSGTVGTFVFKAMKQPVLPEGTASCNLTLKDTILGDPQGNKIPHNVVNGYYDIVPAAIMAVEPSAFHATRVNQTFSVDIVITVAAAQKVVGFDFTLQFNNDLLEVMDVVPGTFLQAFAGPPNGGMFYLGPNKGTGFVRYAGFIFPESTDLGAIMHEPFPSGTGTVATITFKTKGATVITSCDLTLFNTILGDWPQANPVAHVTRNGYYEITIPTLVGDINGDTMVDIFDAVELAKAFGATPDLPHWNASADLNHDDIVDIFDAILLGKHFGEYA